MQGGCRRTDHRSAGEPALRSPRDRAHRRHLLRVVALPDLKVRAHEPRHPCLRRGRGEVRGRCHQGLLLGRLDGRAARALGEDGGVAWRGLVPERRARQAARCERSEVGGRPVRRHARRPYHAHHRRRPGRGLRDARGALGLLGPAHQGGPRRPGPQGLRRRAPVLGERLLATRGAPTTHAAGLRAGGAARLPAAHQQRVVLPVVRR
mmetsp:Transcript_69635/g.201886  ORF Transcript_69635/g.201886 Transcript_69635/m.201886 type:complete len:207 (+) Transcript_69635:996-1616(+)